MKKILLSILATFMFIGCSSSDADNANIKPKLVVGKTLSNLTFNDQHEKPHTLPSDTKTVVFAFSKDVAHVCNSYFAKKSDEYLANKHVVFIADVSAAPSVIRSMFIMPGLKEIKHTVYIIQDKKIAAPYRKEMDVEKIVVADLDNGAITKIHTISTEEELAKVVEK
jgi:hypothetical protein